MKKYFIIAVLFVAGTVGAHAQLLPSFQFGVKGGLNFSTLKNDEGSWLSSNTRTGYQAGVWARIGGAGIHVQPELYVTGKSSETNLVEEGDKKGKVSLTSLDLPVLLGTRIGLGPAGLRIQAGPVFSFVVDKKFGDALGQVTDFDNYKNQSIAIAGGLGLDISNFRADLRYEHGVSNLHQTDKFSQKTSLWSVSVGYRLF